MEEERVYYSKKWTKLKKISRNFVIRYNQSRTKKTKNRYYNKIMELEQLLENEYRNYKKDDTVKRSIIVKKWRKQKQKVTGE